MEPDDETFEAPDIETPQPKTHIHVYGGGCFSCLESYDEIDKMVEEASGMEFLELHLHVVKRSQPEAAVIDLPGGAGAILQAFAMNEGEAPATVEVYTRMKLRVGLIAWYTDEDQAAS